MRLHGASCRSRYLFRPVYLPVSQDHVYVNVGYVCLSQPQSGRETGILRGLKRRVVRRSVDMLRMYSQGCESSTSV